MCPRAVPSCTRQVASMGLGPGRPAQCLWQTHRVAGTNPTQSSPCKAISRLPEHPDPELSGTGTRRRSTSASQLPPAAAGRAAWPQPRCQQCLFSSPCPNCCLLPPLTTSVGARLPGRGSCARPAPRHYRSRAALEGLRLLVGFFFSFKDRLKFPSQQLFPSSRRSIPISPFH